MVKAKAFSKRKGQREEWAVRDLLKDRGWECRTVPLSGAFADMGGDLRAVTPGGVDILVQCKSLSRPTGYKRMFARLGLWEQGFMVNSEWLAGPIDRILGYMEGVPLPLNLPEVRLSTAAADNAVARAGETLLTVKQTRVPVRLALVRPHVLPQSQPAAELSRLRACVQSSAGYGREFSGSGSLPPL